MNGRHRSRGASGLVDALGGSAIRATERRFSHARLGRVDGIIGCGDLAPGWLSVLGDAFIAPLIYVRGNHDHGGTWADRSVMVSGWLASGHTQRLAGIVSAVSSGRESTSPGTGVDRGSPGATHSGGHDVRWSRERAATVSRS